MPTEDIGETYISDYHALLDTAGAELQQDLTPFRIPKSELRRHLAGLSWEGANTSWQVSESKELFCPPHVFRIALSGALKFIKTCPLPQTESLTPLSERPKELEAKTETPKAQARPAPNEKVKKTYGQLLAFRDNLPKGELHISDMDEYHSLLDILESRLDVDLTEYRIPPDAIKFRTGLPPTFGYSIFEGEPPPVEIPVERYIPAEVFKRKLDAVIIFLDRPAPKAPHPSGELSDHLEQILIFLIEPKTDPIPTQIAKHLNVHVQRAIIYLDDLEKDGYIRHRRYGIQGLVGYVLKDKGRRYLADRNLI